MHAYENMPEDLCDYVSATFPWFRPEEVSSISSQASHGCFDGPIVTCCLPLPIGIALCGDDVALVVRKFIMDAGQSFLRAYRVYDGERPSWLPSSAELMFVGQNYAEFKRPAPDIISRMRDFYFSGDPDDVESALDLPERRGQVSTYYGVTFLDGQFYRAKQYVYDQESTFSNWNIAMESHLQRLAALNST